MTKPATPYPAICDDLRSRSASDGALLAVFLNRAAQPLLTMDVSEGTRHVDELFLQHLVAIVADLDVAGVVFAVMRASGRPTRVDRQLWRQLQWRLADASTQLLDLIVVGDETWWSGANAVSRTSATG